jgi:hypothetical protein
MRGVGLRGVGHTRSGSLLWHVLPLQGVALGEGADGAPDGGLEVGRPIGPLPQLHEGGTMILAADYIHPTPRSGRCRVRVYIPDEERDAAMVL